MSKPLLQFDDRGLIPAIVQDAQTREVLMLGYMNQEAFDQTVKTRRVTFYSRSRKTLWTKGETSGNTLALVSIAYDCDEDALLVMADPQGPTCHTGAISCFYRQIGENKPPVDLTQTLFSLEKVIADRKNERPEDSYTTYLFEKGIDKILKKVGEESAEVIIAAKNEPTDELVAESADLLYHLLVLLAERKIPLSDVLNQLEKRKK